MSWRDTLSEAQARRDALEAARDKLLTGVRVLKVSYDGGAVEYAAGATLADLDRAIAETNAVIAKLSGARRTGGVIMPIFRG